MKFEVIIEMKNIHQMLMILVILTVSGCQASQKTPTTPKTMPLIEQQKLFTGHYIWGHEENSFQACGDQQVYWVVSSDERMKNLAKQYEQMTTQPYEEVYFQFRGHYLDKATDGFAAQYHGQVFVEKLIDMKKKTSQDCRDDILKQAD